MDHGIRTILGLTCEQYVFLDFIYNYKSKTPLTYAHIQNAIGFNETHIANNFRLLRDSGFLELKDGRVFTTSIWNEHFSKDDIIPEIVDYLNNCLGTRYTANGADTKKYIQARIKEGRTLDDFKMVIDSRCAAWSEDTQMRQYLRPVTLFGNKFESYLQYAIVNAKKPITNGRESTRKETGRAATNFEHLSGAYTGITD